jgi:hypothetical protein
MTFDVTTRIVTAARHCERALMGLGSAGPTCLHDRVGGVALVSFARNPFKARVAASVGEARLGTLKPASHCGVLAHKKLRRVGS